MNKSPHLCCPRPHTGCLAAPYPDVQAQVDGGVGDAGQERMAPEPLDGPV